MRGANHRSVLTQSCVLGATALVVLSLGLSSPASARKATPTQSDVLREKARRIFIQGQTHYKLGRFDKALIAYTRAYRLLPLAGFLFNIGLAYELAGETGKAVEHYKRYIAEDPDGARVEEARARASKLEGDLAAADEQRRAEDAKQAGLQAQRERVQQLLADAGKRRSAGDYAGAIEAHRAAHELTQDPERLFDIAELHRESGNAVEAKVHFDGYIAAAPTGARHIEARRQVEALTAEIAAAAVPPPAPPQPPGPWSGGVKVGPSSHNPSVTGRSADLCAHEALNSVSSAAFLAYRYKRFFVQALPL